MAQSVKIILEDDIEGGPADETVQFGLDGRQYEIDLSTANAEKLREALRPYAAAGRRAQSKSTRTPPWACPGAPRLWALVPAATAAASPGNVSGQGSSTGALTVAPPPGEQPVTG